MSLSLNCRMRPNRFQAFDSWSLTVMRWSDHLSILQFTEKHKLMILNGIILWYDLTHHTTTLTCEIIMRTDLSDGLSIEMCQENFRLNWTNGFARFYEGHISNDPDIEPLRTQEKGDVTHLLIGRFQELLSNGLVMPGARLPSERELAKNFGVARSSLRQALKVLEIMGVITQKVGDGSYLNKDTSRVLSVPMEFLFLLDGISLDELAKMRLVIEPEHAARAAQRANSDDIALLRQSIGSHEV